MSHNKGLTRTRIKTQLDCLSYLTFSAISYHVYRRTLLIHSDNALRVGKYLCLCEAGNLFVEVMERVHYNLYCIMGN